MIEPSLTQLFMMVHFGSNLESKQLEETFGNSQLNS